MIDLSPITRHERIAFQLSGGKDSTAALFYLKPHWDRMTVYWCNPGDPVPAMQDYVYELREMVPHFKEVRGKRDEAWERGWPTDVVPVDFTPFGHMARGTISPPLQDRYQCCYHALMLPLDEAMHADGITLVIRGQRASEIYKNPMKNGSVIDGIEYLYPIEDWAEPHVRVFLREQGVALAAPYDYMTVSPDCLNCTAWWGEGRARYLREHHPEVYQKYMLRLRYIRGALRKHLMDLDQEV